MQHTVERLATIAATRVICYVPDHNVCCLGFIVPCNLVLKEVPNRPGVGEGQEWKLNGAPAVPQVVA